VSDAIPLREHLDALREADLRFSEERDRRYAEVAEARAEALKIKEEADKVALDLARQIQTYKDEKANELREQINSERGLYVTKAEFKPVQDFIAAAAGRSAGFGQIAALVLGSAAILGVIVAIATYSTT
jgi:vacuolar-type H+-ATPase subunit H